VVAIMKRWFNYEGVDEHGRVVSGALEAAAFPEVETRVRGQGIEPTRVYELDRVRVIERSLECFTQGWLSLIPVLGIFAAIQAMILHHQVRSETGREWNPAGRYLLAGFVLAWTGSLLSILAAGRLMVLLVKAIADW
jgi:hypothetical protein